MKVFFEHKHPNLVTSSVRKKQCSYAIEDIFDGKCYKVKYSEEALNNMMSVNFSIDGTPVFKTSHSSVTPILCTINKLHPQERIRNIMLVSVFLGSKKPKIVKEANLLYTNVMSAA